MNARPSRSAGSGNRILFRPADKHRVPGRSAMGGWDKVRGRLIGDPDGRPISRFSRQTPPLRRALDRRDQQRIMPRRPPRLALRVGSLRCMARRLTEAEWKLRFVLLR
jgi:hypothetical protein